ncbi:unnamed protein product [Cuscuta epithymum]|uniref:SUN domain-containing protein n=1 Tax=Cuscuta epithymum TaxID=186058 RepID=A0AAV0CYZ0_9ASTE|nr:unnamed protein product [Cuscuta epithymum]
MSTSTQSVTANSTSILTRRRAALERQQYTTVSQLPDSNLATDTAVAAAVPPSPGNDIFAAGDAPAKEPNLDSRKTETRNAVPVVKTPFPNSNGAAHFSRRAATTKRVPKPVKPRWLTVVRALTKISLVLLILFGFVEMVRRLVIESRTLDTDGFALISGDIDGKLAEVEDFVKKTTKLMQVQVEVIDQKLENELRTAKGELSNKMEAREMEFESKLKEMDERIVNLETSVSETEAKEYVSKEELLKFLEEFKDMKGREISYVNLDEVRSYAREIVEKEIAKHAADGLGRVDYALHSGGAMVVKHSEPYIISNAGRGGWIPLATQSAVHKHAHKILTPSFGEPGQCFPLRGSKGFVQVRLRTAIIPEAVTLEHVAKSVAYDRSSAPKDCRVSGWLQGQDMADVTPYSEKMCLLTEFTYDLEKSNAQTYNVFESAATCVVDTIRFDFSSNHGSISHTCIYRLRVHGREANSMSLLA